MIGSLDGNCANEVNSDALEHCDKRKYISLVQGTQNKEKGFNTLYNISTMTFVSVSILNSNKHSGK